MYKAIKYRLYPTDEQATLFVKTFGCCRKVYNLMLADKIACYKETGSFGKQSAAMYKKDYPYLKEVDGVALNQTTRDLQAAMDNCFNKKHKKQNGFPNFKSVNRSRKAYRTYGNIAIVDNKYIKLPKAGLVKAKIHRVPPSDWELRSITVSQDRAGSFFASALFRYNEDIVPVSISDNAIGLKYVNSGLYVDDKGNIGVVSKFWQKSHGKLVKMQIELSHKMGAKSRKDKSNNYMKQLTKMNKVYRHVTNQRLDTLHKLSTEIADKYDIVCVESVNLQSMANKNTGNEKYVMDNGYGMFLNMLEYKLADRGKYFIKVDISQITENANASSNDYIENFRQIAVEIKNKGLSILKSS